MTDQWRGSSWRHQQSETVVDPSPVHSSLITDRRECRGNTRRLRSIHATMMPRNRSASGNTDYAGPIVGVSNCRGVSRSVANQEIMKKKRSRRLLRGDNVGHAPELKKICDIAVVKRKVKLIVKVTENIIFILLTRKNAKLFLRM